MRIAIALLFLTAAFGQGPRPPGFVRGVLIANNPSDLVVQESPDLSYHYRADSRTWIEREQERVKASDLRPGEILEVVSDRDAQPIRYARMIHVIPKAVPRRPKLSANGVYRLAPATDLDAPELVFTGIICGREGQRLTLRTRFDGEISIFLRSDTHLVSEGAETTSENLVVNTRVFIRASPNLEHQLEAYEVIWGATVLPSVRE